jgi:CRP-like cAMP-binding protein
LKNSGALQLIFYEDIASIIGTSGETVTRVMAELKISGVIQKRGKNKSFKLSPAC